MPSELNPDFADLIRSLTAHHVDFLVVGAHALAFHGVARYTADLDLWIQRTSANADRLRAALTDFGIALGQADAEQMTKERKFMRFGHEPARIEILNFLDGCDFETALSRSLEEDLAGVKVRILGLEDYVLTKKASGRPKDASDLAMLRSMLGQLPGDPAK